MLLLANHRIGNISQSEELPASRMQPRPWLRWCNLETNTEQHSTVSQRACEKTESAISYPLPERQRGPWSYRIPPGQNDRHFADDIFRYIFLNENFCILIKISLKFVPKGQIDNNPPLVQIIAWCRMGDKPLFEPMLTRFTDAYMRHKGEIS